MAFNIIDGEVRITDENGNVVTATPLIKDQLTPDVITYILSVAVEKILQSQYDGTQTIIPVSDDKNYQLLLLIYMELQKLNKHMSLLNDYEIQSNDL